MVVGWWRYGGRMVVSGCKEHCEALLLLPWLERECVVLPWLERERVWALGGILWVWGNRLPKE